MVLLFMLVRGLISEKLASHPQAITIIPVPEQKKGRREQMEANKNFINNTSRSAATNDISIEKNNRKNEVFIGS